MSRANVSTTGIWSRRELPAATASEVPARSWQIGGSTDIVTPAAAPRNLPAPLGDLSRASIAELQAAACSLLPRSGIQLDKRRRSIRKVAEHLSTFEGGAWQERWDASGYDTSEERLASLNPPASKSWTMTSGLTWLVGMRVIVPSVLTLRRDVVSDFSMIFRECQKDPLLAQVVDRIRNASNPDLQKHRALTELSYVLASQGIPVADLTPGALIHFDVELRNVGRGRETYERQIGALIWEVLHTMGRFPERTPATIRRARQGGPRSVEEFVDYHGVRDAGMRQLLIDYINQRAALGMDYSSLRGLTGNLVRNFWCVIEGINPEQHDLDLNEETYEAWRQEVDTISTPEGPKPRQGIWDLLIAVRALYLDLQTWAMEDPARWGSFATRCPIPPIASRGYSAGRRRQAERMADRTRARQPLLDHLIRHVTAEKDRLQAFRAAASASLGAAGFDFDGVHYTHVRRATPVRSSPQKGPRARRGVEFEEPPQPERQLRVLGAAAESINISAEEDQAFWTWAAVEVLRLTGIRHEELLELSHLSIRQYRRPNGEVVGLLVVTPSKSDRERVIPMSPELLHVIAEVIRRHTTNLGSIPLVRRWDPLEREHSDPLPYLFQYTAGPLRGVFSTSRIAKLVHKACATVAKDRPEFEGLSFTPHDFRRIFATDLVNNGLPIHIGAALLGHANLQTTRGYVAVFDEDVVRHYQMHMANRRALRPDHEYAEVADAEWEEFEEHFDKRKVELGSCGRPYGTPCAHEHACVRCPMLHVEPRMILRLDELEADLIARRERAENEGWKGEVDGLELTLGHLRDKRGRAIRLQKQSPC
ncbi:tyrosine-type recombinase/integrase [Arthrobacter sp. 24S4-2]|uniref:tyrosine-type recombinase/integrase n=1 Tax=Arthrobacter sp. 24S4-2 TaxID=2575374 RepID=UPI0015861E23|nr:tyrosine-type recombinase/integrase [Arthrobacter sp. 24S4-2]